MSPLRAFIAECAALPKTQARLASGEVVQGEFCGIKSNQTVEAALADLLAFVERLENDDDPRTIECHDALTKIVSSAAPLQHRARAFVEYLKPYLPARQ